MCICSHGGITGCFLALDVNQSVEDSSSRPSPATDNAVIILTLRGQIVKNVCALHCLLGTKNCTENVSRHFVQPSCVDMDKRKDTNVTN